MVYCVLKVEDQLNRVLTPIQQQQWKLLVSPYRLNLQRIDVELELERNEEKRKN